ncbi:hypothetical protein CCM_02570 [Cordyceps militaris CM01]|uniref:Uncharacterized protein n=1 Tax=Cordyceps militaris (strain CM01) TaxID=983644 RepID=G3JAI3_CORMM|nr:uncharacterized protein CCM_02570 [Cordyceps militaris CM01]EGX94299.1 hypothetical protein CCM_02570 [Cordyceps militaris CM01]
MWLATDTTHNTKCRVKRAPAPRCASWSAVDTSLFSRSSRSATQRGPAIRHKRSAPCGVGADGLGTRSNGTFEWGVSNDADRIERVRQLSVNALGEWMGDATLA